MNSGNWLYRCHASRAGSSDSVKPKAPVLKSLRMIFLGVLRAHGMKFGLFDKGMVSNRRKRDVETAINTREASRGTLWFV